MTLFPGPPGWASPRRELLHFMVQGKTNRGIHTDHPAGCHSIRTNQCPPPPSPLSPIHYTTDNTSETVEDRQLVHTTNRKPHKPPLNGTNAYDYEWLSSQLFHSALSRRWKVITQASCVTGLNRSTDLWSEVQSRPQPTQSMLQAGSRPSETMVLLHVTLPQNLDFAILPTSSSHTLSTHTSATIVRSQVVDNIKRPTWFIAAEHQSQSGRQCQRTTVNCHTDQN